MAVWSEGGDASDCSRSDGGVSDPGRDIAGTNPGLPTGLGSSSMVGWHGGNALSASSWKGDGGEPGMVSTVWRSSRSKLSAVESTDATLFRSCAEPAGSAARVGCLD